MITGRKLDAIHYNSTGGGFLMNKNILYSIESEMIGAVMRLIMSFLANYSIINVPTSEISNAVGNGASGFMGGFIGC